jgi:hypothetical protein
VEEVAPEEPDSVVDELPPLLPELDPVVAGPLLALALVVADADVDALEPKLCPDAPVEVVTDALVPELAEELRPPVPAEVEALELLPALPQAQPSDATRQQVSWIAARLMSLQG